MLAEKIPANKLVRLACQRYLEDLEEADLRGLYFDWTAAERACVFFETFLCHSKGEWGGKPFLLGAWQKFIVANLFGWKRKFDRTRRFRMAYIEVPKKNGKSTFCAGIALYMLVCDQEPGAEIYAFATKKDQAKIIFDEAVRMWENSPALQKHVGHFRNNLHVRATNSKFEPISSDEGTNDGLNPSCGIGDEIHRHPNRSLFDLLESSTASRRQPLMIGITTAGTDRLSFCYDQHHLCEQILSGVLQNDSVFAFIACLDQEQDGDWKKTWRNETEWAKANPNYGQSVKIENMRDEAKLAAQQPTKLNDFLRFRLNVWTQGSTRALSPEKWRACAGVSDDEPADQVLKRWEAELLGQPCYCGLDLANTIDMASFVVFFPKTAENPVARVLAYYWCPEDAIRERSMKARVPYDIWAARGFVFATPGEVIDYDAIRAFIKGFNDDHYIVEIGYDRWNSTQLMTQLGEQDGIAVVKVGQGFEGMNASTQELLKMVKGVEFAHGHHPILTWNADNLVVSMNAAGFMKPDKAKAREKIDGMVALSMAIGRWQCQPDGPPGRGVGISRL